MKQVPGMTDNDNDKLIGDAPELATVLRAARLVAMTDAPVLIQGESGTGKELLAARVHRDSPRRAGPLITVNCAALPEALAESLLYGHRKGAFTGATANHDGYVLQANGGTLLLDEIGELSLAVQAKLLRFLESGECQPVGQPTSVTANVRIIAATNRDLGAEAAAGRFRQDLFYRLNVVPLTLPPLRERREDIPALLHYHSEQVALRYGLEAPRIGRQALHALCGYTWPGNVRELRNLCERLVILCGGREIEVENLPVEIRNPQSAAHRGGYQLPPDGVRLDELEVTLIRQALAHSAGNRSRAARLLGLTRDTLLYRLKKYAIE
jgi:DNA-binding NtrC family response regulator